MKFQDGQINEMVKKISIKGYYLFKNQEYNCEQALYEVDKFLKSHLNFINNISSVNFKDIQTSSYDDGTNIYVFFNIDSSFMDYKYYFLENDNVKNIKTQIEILLGAKITIE